MKNLDIFRRMGMEFGTDRQKGRIYSVPKVEADQTTSSSSSEGSTTLQPIRMNYPNGNSTPLEGRSGENKA